MSKNIATSSADRQAIEHLLEKKLPTYRQAYSDRTSWMMACISELAYLRFNPLFSNPNHKGYFIAAVKKLVEESKLASLEKLIDKLSYDSEKETENLKANLALLQLQLVDTFDENGTQAIIVANWQYAILAFRGTETTSIRDIKADVKANKVKSESGGNIHSGFQSAYNEVALKIQQRLSEEDLSTLPLYITGHSLGGALATIAAKNLNHRAGIAAGYTFGAPRVGDDDWICDIKTPLYRIVNAADCVTMLPPGDGTVSVISWVVQWLPYIGKSLRRWLLANFQGYLHAGNMRYMTNCKNGNFKEVKLLYSVSLLYRIKGFILKTQAWSKPLADHSISTYRKKLMIIAQQRNP